MKTYEYRLVSFKPREITTKVLKEYGDDGWLVCSINKDGNTGYFVVTFARENSIKTK